MTQQIGDLFSANKYSEPPEIQQIKSYVQDIIGITSKVSIKEDAYIIYVASAAAAGTLRTKIFDLQAKVNTEKRLLIRIG